MAAAALIDFESLDLRSAFDFAILIEEDAQDRYGRLVLRLAGDPGGAAEVCREMVATEARHRADLVARRAELFRDAPPRLEALAPDEGVERPEVDDDDLPRSAREALEIALAAEQRAHAYYSRILPRVKDPDVRAFFERLRREEAEHAALIADAITARGETQTPAPPPRAPSAPAPAPSFPDRAALGEALGRFDAATQAVARAVVVDGQPEAQVASALGVSRRTVARRLAQFLEHARRPVAIGLAVATLSSCTAGFPRADGQSSARAEVQQAGGLVMPDRVERAALARAADPDDGVAREAAPLPGLEGPGRGSLAERVLAHVARRMARHAPAVQARVAQAVIEEARRAGLDPAVVLAVIHVESSFDPLAISHARAFGLMQVREPTFHRERARSGLPSADPRDPVANVQAGVRYLRRLVDAFDGDLDVALMAYNAGPNRIRSHLRGGGIPERFHGYPRKVNRELERLRDASEPLYATADAPSRPRG